MAPIIGNSCNIRGISVRRADAIGIPRGSEIRQNGPALFARAVDPDQHSAQVWRCWSGQWLAQHGQSQSKYGSARRCNRSRNCNLPSAATLTGQCPDFGLPTDTRSRRGDLRGKPGKQRQQGKENTVHSLPI